ncbi:hypothetical protein ACODT3_19140 [Streptomyces sp. 4.24]|uniref:hypothetical protein n=1 Tax=Streptomyces tritrimontium TaxID=3406573 RepID=UPI003BB6A424
MYWCEIATHASTYSCLLRGSAAATPRLAVRWLRDQAQHVADLMDPQPASWWVPKTPSGRTPLRPVESGARDAPEELRLWSRDALAHEYAMGALTSGALFQFSTGDGTAFISLSARLVNMTIPATCPAPPPVFSAA